MQDPSHPLRRFVVAGFTSGMTVAAALGLAGVLVRIIGAPPLLAAMGAAMTLAMLEWVLRLPGPYASAELDTLHVALWGTSLLAASICLAVLAADGTILGGLRFAPAAGPTLVGLYITAAYWFTASTSFANPAVTIARALSDTFAGIDPAHAPGFVAAELLGAVAGGYLWGEGFVAGRTGSGSR
jgi:hypothetical protein